MAGYLVEEFIENEPTGRSWRVYADSPLQAAFRALGDEEHDLVECAALHFKISLRNRFGRSEFVKARTVLSPASRSASAAARKPH